MTSSYDESKHPRGHGGKFERVGHAQAPGDVVMEDQRWATRRAAGDWAQRQPLEAFRKDNGSFDIRGMLDHAKADATLKDSLPRDADIERVVRAATLRWAIDNADMDGGASYDVGPDMLDELDRVGELHEDPEYYLVAEDGDDDIPDYSTILSVEADRQVEHLDAAGSGLSLGSYRRSRQY